MFTALPFLMLIGAAWLLIQFATSARFAWLSAFGSSQDHYRLADIIRQREQRTTSCAERRRFIEVMNRPHRLR